MVSLESPSSLSENDSTAPFVFHHQQKSDRCSTLTYLVYINAFFTFCTIAFCAILLWFLFSLKAETSTISRIINSVDSSRKNFDLEFQNLHTSLRQAHKQLATLTHNVTHMSDNFQKIQRKFILLDHNVRAIVGDNSIKLELRKLPIKFGQLQQIVASLGSSVKQLQVGAAQLHSAQVPPSLLMRVSALERGLSLLRNDSRLHQSALRNVSDVISARTRRSASTCPTAAWRAAIGSRLAALARFLLADSSGDGWLDSKEMSRLLAVACRDGAALAEALEFDADLDGRLSQVEALCWWGFGDLLACQAK